MRRATVVPSLLLLLGCGNNLGPADDLSGTWAATYSFPGSSMVLTLAQVGTSVTGTGTYQMEAGSGGTLRVAGTYQRPSVNLVLYYSGGHDEAYVGTAEDRSHITGALSGTFPLPLVRR